MANANSPFGLKQLGLNGAPTNGQLSWRKGGILYTDNTPMYTNDLFMRNAGGYMTEWTNGTAVSQAGGIFFGCEYYSNSQQTKVFNRYWPGTDAAADPTIFFIPFTLTPSPLFVIQSGAAGIAAADVGQNADIVVGTGSAVTGYSGAYLSTITTTATVPFTIVDLWSNWMGGQVGPGTQAGAYNWVVVAANNMQITGI